MRVLKVVIHVLDTEQVLCDTLNLRKAKLSAVPSGSGDARVTPSHKTLMTLNRESVKTGGTIIKDTAKCPHLRAHLAAKGGNNVFWVKCQQCGMQWNRGFGMAKQNLRAQALEVLPEYSIPPPRCPMPECRKSMILRQGKECIFWGCRGYPEPKVKTATKDHCNFALSCYQSPPYQLNLFRDNMLIEQLAEQSFSTSGVISIPNFPTQTIASTLWIEAGATVNMINPRSWLECQLSEKVNFSPEIRTPRTGPARAPTSTITIEEDASSSTAMSTGDLSKDWAVVMEVDLDDEERKTVEAFKEMISTGGLTIGQASLQVSSRPNDYLYTSQVGAEISKIIDQKGL